MMLTYTAGVIEVSNADRVVFPDIGRTKGDVVRYYERLAERLLPHVLDRPLSMRRYPKGLSGPGFFQKNVPAHYPESIARVEIPRSREASRKHRDQREVTVYPVVRSAEHLPYLANQGAIELHVPTARASSGFRPDRVVIDLDPPPGAIELVRRAAHLTRELLASHGLATVPVATGSKGYHLVANITSNVDGETLMTTMQRLAALAVHQHPEELTTVFRVANRGARVFVDWLRNTPLATVVAPYSLRARPRATVATPLSWSELDTFAPDELTIADVDRLRDRPDTLAELAAVDAAPFVASVERAFDDAGLVLETFDRFRS